MATALKYLFNELIQLHLIIKRRVKDIIDAILLIELDVLSMLDLSLGNLVLSH